MPESRLAVPVREGIALSLEQDDSGTIATIILSQSNTLRPLFSGRLTIADALRKAEEFSSESGFEGYYEISGPDEWSNRHRADLQGAVAEIQRQTEALRPKAGAWWAPHGPSVRELAGINPVRAQMTRLANLRDALLDAMVRP